MSDPPRAQPNTQNELRDLLYIVSHDFSAPLRGIVEFSRLLKDEAKELNGEAATYLQIIMESGQKMQIMLAALIEFLMINTQTLTRKTIDLNLVLDQCQKNMRTQIEESKATIRDDPLPKIQGDEDQILKLFTALIENALTFHDPEKPPRIEITGSAGAEGVKITIADEGIGMDPKYINEAFRPFKRLTIERGDGPGMGLPTARKIAERHGGTLEISSRLKQGTSVVVSFPALASAA